MLLLLTVGFLGLYMFLYMLCKPEKKESDGILTLIAVAIMIVSTYISIIDSEHKVVCNDQYGYISIQGDIHVMSDIQFETMCGGE